MDFRKAFDSISWDSLLKILWHRGFPPRFCDWISDLLSSIKTAVSLNDTPGDWIQCKKGLRQGDPISPYLFIIVADVLQQMIRTAAADDPNLLRHPVFPELPPSVLQYADGTLIITHASAEAAFKLKQILDDFASATGLCINFSKTTLIPMNVDTSTSNLIAQTLGCSTSCFPQTYLGLPLSPHKLPPTALPTNYVLL